MAEFDKNLRVLNKDTMSSYSTNLTDNISLFSDFYNKVWNEALKIDRIKNKHNINITDFGYSNELGGVQGLNDFGGSKDVRLNQYENLKKEVHQILKKGETFYFYSDSVLTAKIEERKVELQTLKSFIQRYGEFADKNKLNSATFQDDLKNLRKEVYDVSSIWESLIQNTEKEFDGKMMTEDEVMALLQKKYGNALDDNKIKMLAAYANYYMKNPLYRDMKNVELSIVKVSDGKGGFTYKIEERDKLQPGEDIIVSFPGGKLSSALTLLGNCKFGEDGSLDTVALKNPKNTADFKVGLAFRALNIQIGDGSSLVDIDMVNINADVSANGDFDSNSFGFNADFSVSAIDMTTTLFEMKGRNKGFRVNGTLSILSAGAKLEVRVNGIAMKVSALAIGLEGEFGIFEVIDEVNDF